MKNQRSSQFYSNLDSNHGRSLRDENWWHPLTSKRWYHATVTGFLFALMVTVGALFGISTRDQGIADVNTEGYAKYAWVIVPSLTMTILGIAFNALDSNARTLHPFQQLLRGKGSIDGLLFDPFAGASIATIIPVLTRRHWYLAALMLIGMLTPVLTVLTSGLYAPYAVPATAQFSADMQGWFDIKPKNADLNNEVADATRDYATIVEFIQFYDFAFPPWTWDELAFPVLPVPAGMSFTNASGSSSTISARLPALRGKFNCSLLEYLDSVPFTDTNQSSRLQPISITPPRDCPFKNDTIQLQLDGITPPR